MKLARIDPAARVAWLYVAVAASWILLSDEVLVRWAGQTRWLAELEALKGWLFVGVTAVLLYVERRHADGKVRPLAAAVESMDAAVESATLDGVITSWNPGAESLYGYSANEAVGRSISMLVLPAQHAELSEYLEKIGAGESIGLRESVRVRKNGEKVWVSVIISPVRDAAGRVVGISAVARDISDRKRAEQSLRMAEVGKLASGFVHEIRNPLNAMRMQIAVVRSKLGNPSEAAVRMAVTQLERLEKEVLRVQGLATVFLAYGRPAPDKPEIIALPTFIANIVEFLKPEFAESGMGIELESSASAHRMFVRMDPGKLRQVLLNLVENARYAMAKGGQLTIKCDRLSDHDARIRVCDTGCGIPADKLPYIFDAYYSKREGGTGLGLAIAKQTIEAAGGHVSVESEVGRGTCFEIILPTVSRTLQAEVELQPAGATDGVPA
ncbi:MAG TPA: PAS domain S-box protein [Phycisphaerae bacterium]|nr:PAS domain S-box protein [Phycisphaerae bacterium]